QHTEDFENDVLGKDGVYTVLWNATRMTGPEGKVLGLMAVGRDITERRRTERRLQQSEARLRWINGAMPGAVFVGSLEPGQPPLLYVSDAVEELLGESPEDILADVNRLRQRVHPEDRERAEALPSLLRRKKSACMDLRVRGKDGDLRQVRMKAVVQSDAEGTPLWVGLVTDVTAEQAMERRIQLAGRLSSLGTLSAGMAHELNNPLSYVLANLSYAVETLGQWPQTGELPELLSALTDAMEGATRVQAIVADLKTFSRVDDPGEAEVELGAVLAVALRVTRHALRRHAQLEDSPPLVPPSPLWGNHARLAQSFVNLLLHMGTRLPMEHREQQHLHLQVWRSREEVVVDIEDNGPPIPPNHIEHLFDPWFEARPDVSGLALTLAHTTLQKMGGRIEVESDVGRTRMRVRLPIYMRPEG
ncbi:MAG TPA: PAS domain S-box protein, partial [Myxococcota bacterium]|nr:PAS domain S-box protein [Myxococcota bacterium]